MKRSNRHIWMGMGFVAASIIVAATLYFGMKLTNKPPQPPPESAETEVVTTKAPANESDAIAVAATNSNEEASAPPSRSWLVGSWRTPMPGDPINGIAYCETDGIVTFNRDGTYSDGGSRGSYKIKGNDLTYFDIVLYDSAAAEGEQEDFSQYETPTVARIERQADHVMIEDGEILHRCR